MIKRSEELREKARGEENDLKAMGILNKALREDRIENFKEKWLQKLVNKVEQVVEDNNKFTFIHQKYGKMSFFPKANKLHFHSTNKWKKPGLKFIVEHIIKKS